VISGIRCFLPIFVSISVPCSALIFENDDRVYASFEDAHFRSIGLIRSGLGLGTGFLVDNCHVLTSRHVKSENENVLGGRLTFIPTVRTSIGSVGGTVIASGDAPNSDAKRGPQRDRRGDWLLLKLDRCVGAELGFVSLNGEPARVGAPLMNAGFPVDRPRHAGLTIDPACRVHYITRNGALHDCAFLAGNSGGPLFERTFEGGQVRLRAIAIGSAGYRDKKNYEFDAARANVATLIAPILPALREYLRPIYIGSNLSNKFTGSGLIDHLQGNSGDDYFILDKWGGDLIVGGPGKDHFVLQSDSGRGHIIADFRQEEGDILDFGTVDADHTVGGVQAFRLMEDSLAAVARGSASLQCASHDGPTTLRLYVRHRGLESSQPDYEIKFGRCVKNPNGFVGLTRATKLVGFPIKNSDRFSRAPA